MSSMEVAKITFLDSGRNPTCPSNPKFPNGIIVDMSHGFSKRCDFKIPYPAPRCGIMHVVCNKCKTAAGVTVAGRLDDPHTVIMGCHASKLVEDERLRANEQAFSGILASR